MFEIMEECNDPLSKKNRLIWTETTKLHLAQACQRKRGHIKTKDIKMSEKWLSICECLRDYNPMEFNSHTPEPMALQNQFKKLQDDVLTKYGIDKDKGINLSGLPEVPPPYDKLMIDLWNEYSKEEKKRKRESMKRPKQPRSC